MTAEPTQLMDVRGLDNEEGDINVKIRVSAKAGDPLTSGILYEGYDQFIRRRSKFERLYNYYMGRHPVATKGAVVIDNMCRYGVDNITSYIAGNKPTYVYDEGEKDGQEDAAAKTIIDVFETQDMADQETSINLDIQRYGRALQLVFLDDEGEPDCVMIDPRNGFVAFDRSTDPDSVYGAIVRTETTVGSSGIVDKVIHYMDVYSPGAYSLWKSSDPANASSWTEVVEERKITRFTRVNLIEYQPNGDYIGCIQGVTSLQDALNRTLGDVQDDKDAFADTILFTTASLMGRTAEEMESSTQAVKNTRTLQGDEGDMAQWLIKQMDETPQMWADRLVAKMHKNMRVPDFSDEAFAGNASGIALQYKLFGTEMIANIISRWFNKGFKRRCKLYDEALNNSSASMDYEVQADIGKMYISFNYSTVVDPLTEATAMQAYINTGVVSKETVMGMATIISDIDLEKERLDAEQKVADERERKLYEDQFALVVEQNKSAQGDDPEEAETRNRQPNTPPTTKSTVERAPPGATDASE